MSLRLTVDKAGRVVLSKRVRDELQLAPGDTLELDSENERIILRPVRSITPLGKERGVWVYRTGRPLTAAAVEAALRQGREDREIRNTVSSAGQVLSSADACF